MDCCGDIVHDPNTPHTVDHDLESFFWVLLWIVATRVKTNMDENEHSNLVNGTMCPKITGGSGGDIKRNFLELPSTLSRFQIPGNFHLGELVVDRKSTRLNSSHYGL